MPALTAERVPSSFAVQKKFKTAFRLYFFIKKGHKKMKNITKIFCIILAVLVIVPAIVGCTDGPEDDVTTVADSTAAETVSDTEAETETDTEEEITTSEETEAETEPAADLPVVYVTIYDGEKIAAAEAEVKKSDEDEDGKWTINDALIALHKEKCADGYAASSSDYGLMITKLWGVENGGAYGFYRNNKMCMGLTEELSEADHLYAYVYSDATGYSDVFTFFDQSAVSGDKATLTLKYVTFDESYNQVDVPLEGAVITVDGNATELVTAEDGTVEIDGLTEGAVISAYKVDFILIPPVCVCGK